jgi:hypothetical protein
MPATLCNRRPPAVLSDVVNSCPCSELGEPVPLCVGLFLPTSRLSVKIKEKAQWRGQPPHLSKSASGSKSTATCRPSSETFKLDNPRPPGQRRAAFIFAKVINRSAAISGAYHAPAQTHDLPRLSHIGLHLFVSPKALHRPLWANTIGSSLCCIRCSQLMDCVLAAPEIVGTAVNANRQKQAANTRTIYYLHPLMSDT